MSTESVEAETSQQVPDGDSQNPHPINSPDYFLWELEQLDSRVNASDDSRLKPVSARRMQKYWHERAESLGIDLKEHSLSKQDPLRRLLADPSLVNSNEDELTEIRDAFQEIDDLSAAEESVKKKWIELIDLTLELQDEAREAVAKFSVYVLRCQQTNNILHMSEVHLDWFRVWANPKDLNSEIEAPPGTGKTTCLYGQELWDFKDDQRLRMLRQSADFDTASKRMDTVRRYIQHRRYRAVAPHVRIDFTQPSNAKRFTLIRENIGSQDPSMQAAGALSEFQGAGFERIDCDDLCSDKVRNEPSLRTRIWSRFHGNTLKRIRDYDITRVRYIATPWHVADPTSRLRKGIETGEMVGWVAKQYPRPHDAEGNPLPLVKRPDWKRRRATLINQKKADPLTYACCEKLDPKDEALRKLTHVVYYDVSGGTDPLCPQKSRVYYQRLLEAINAGERWQVLDPAAGGADRTGMVGFSLSRREEGLKTAAITSARFFSNTADKVVKEVKAVVTAERAHEVLMESGSLRGQVDMWTMYLTTWLGKDYGKHIHTTGFQIRDKRGRPAGQNLSKGNRYYAAMPMLISGVVMLPGRWQRNKYVKGGAKLVCCDDPGLKELHTQLHDYPAVTHDDGLDCVSMFINYHAWRLAQSIESLRKPKDIELAEPTHNPLTIKRRQMEAARLKRIADEKKFGRLGGPGVRHYETQLLNAG